jgi:hypothetical protein
VEIINKMENKQIGKRVILKAVNAQKYENNGPIFFGKYEYINKKLEYSAIFLEKRKRTSVNWQKLNSPICFEIEKNVNNLVVYIILKKLEISGKIFYNDHTYKKELIEIAPSFLMIHSQGKIPLLTYLYLCNRIIISTILYGFDSSIEKTFLNFYNRPRRGFYKIINNIEKSIRKIRNTIFGERCKSLHGLFGIMHKKRNNSLDSFGVKILDAELRKFIN